MNARRLFGAGATALLMAGTVILPASGTAVAAPSGTSKTTTRAAATNYRLVRSAQMRRLSTTATLKAVTKAVNGSEFTEGVPASDYSVTGLRVSGSWARATIQPKSGADLDTATVLLTKSRTNWTVVDLGTAEVGCGIAPAGTLKALRLTCP